MERATDKTKLSQRLVERESEDDCEKRRVVRLPVIVEPVVAPVPPTVVPIQVTDVEVAIRVAVMHDVPSIAPPLEYSRDCIVFVIIIT